MDAICASAFQFEPIVSSDVAKAEFCDNLRDHVIYKRNIAVEQLARHSGVCEGSIRSYMRAECPTEPPFSKALSLLCVLGAGAINKHLSRIGYACIPMDEPDEADLLELMPQMLQIAAVFAEILKDGKIDQHEEPHATRGADMLIEMLLPLSSWRKAE